MKWPKKIFIWQIISWHLTFKYNFGHMATTTILHKGHSGGPIFDHLFKHLRAYFSNDTLDIGFQSVNRCWFIHVNQ